MYLQMSLLDNIVKFRGQKKTERKAREVNKLVKLLEVSRNLHRSSLLTLSTEEVRHAAKFRLIESERLCGTKRALSPLPLPSHLSDILSLEMSSSSVGANLQTLLSPLRLPFSLTTR